MKGTLKRIFIFFLVAVFGMGMLSGCAFFQTPEYDIDEGYDDPEDYVEPDYDFTVSCTEDKTMISLGDIGYYGDTAQLIYLKPYQYLYGEGDYGLAEELDVTPTVVGEYECQTEQTITIDRYNKEGYDTVYCKFYVVQGRNILAGPIYPTEIQPIYTHDEVIKTRGIKGVTSDDRVAEEVENLGCEHTAINMLATGLIVPLETVDEEGNITPIEYEKHTDGYGQLYLIGPDPGDGRQYVEEYEHNGKTYYFRIHPWRGYPAFDYYDMLLSSYTRKNIKVTVIVLEQPELNQYITPYFLFYNGTRTGNVRTFIAVNTANEYGAEYWAAFTEYLANRYSQEESAEDAMHGTVESYVMGNEIDYPDDWNSMVDPAHQAVEMEDYAAEFERMLRITNQSFKKVCKRNIPLLSFTHNWGGSGYARAYSPKEIFDYISIKTLREGNYNWGLAGHPYGADLSITEFWKNDVGSGEVTGNLNTKKITWTNLEVLQLYLEQPIKLCNGEVRSVFLTEGGVSTGDSSKPQYTENLMKQAAGVSYAYYKSSQLSCIKALVYYRLQDNLMESGLFFGLLTVGNPDAEDPALRPKRKPAYEVYKAIDTEETWSVSEPYLEYIQWSRYENGSLTSYGKIFGNVHDYRDVMGILPSKFDWETRWDESKIVMR